MSDDVNVRTTARAIAARSVAPGGEANLRRNGKAALAVPQSSLEIALVARQYSRSMIRVLVRIAQDKNQAPAARVQASKEVLRLAAFDGAKSQLDLLDEERLVAMATALVEKLRKEERTYTVVREAEVVEKGGDDEQ